MKKILIRTILLIPFVYMVLGCDSDTQQGEGSGGTGDQLQAITTELASALTGNEVTRAITDFAVNSTDDPTASMDFRTNWDLGITIYKFGQPYAEGSSSFIWNNADKKWYANQQIYYPHYLMQTIAADMIPSLWNGIETDQRLLDVFRSQDLLEQNADDTISLRPSHILNIPMRHKHSMIDFILYDIDTTQIVSIDVTVGTDTYYPYKLPDENSEYMLILPVGSPNPIINITTLDGARYKRELPITPTLANNCYCVTLKGLELILSPITVANWKYGEAIAAEYTTVTSYPTFRGPADMTVTLGFDNGLTQTITFNDRGATTVQPAGRTIISITPKNGTAIIPAPPIILRWMVIDLSPYLQGL